MKQNNPNYKDIRLPKRFQYEPTCIKVQLLEEQNKAYRKFIELVVDDIHNKGHYHNDPVLERLV